MQHLQQYRFPRGFAYRRESFGGILYFYQGDKPDPQVLFVDSPFLVDLLDWVEKAALGEVMERVREHFDLSPGEVRRMESFFETLISRGALVQQ